MTQKITDGHHRAEHQQLSGLLELKKIKVYTISTTYTDDLRNKLIILLLAILQHVIMT